ncbi:MAG: hypothetical protein HC917_27970 [Richelia sp. SM2_1_7]|nr:hypothetical protein [Richelia sp. SM2_1_7]
MIKSFLLNSLFVPLRQVSPQMLLASATLHGLLLVAPISSNSANVDTKDTTNVSEAGTDESLLNQDSSPIQQGTTGSLKQGDVVKVPGEPPLLSDLENATNEDNTTPDLTNTDSGALDETPTSNFSSGGDDISSSPEFPTTSDDVSLSEPNSEPQIAFKPSQPVDEPASEPIIESVAESTNTVSETEETTQSESTNTASEPEQIAQSESTDSTTESQPEETSSEPNNTTTERAVNPFADFPTYSNLRPIFVEYKTQD